MDPSNVAFARRLAVQLIGYWREAGREGLPRTRAMTRREALYFLRLVREARRHDERAAA